jgi:hypothetical protein
MKTIPYRCDDSRHKALLSAARSTGTSVQRLFDNFVTHVITERQAEARFVARQKRCHETEFLYTRSFAAKRQATCIRQNKKHRRESEALSKDIEVLFSHHFKSSICAFSS